MMIKSTTIIILIALAQSWVHVNSFSFANLLFGVGLCPGPLKKHCPPCPPHGFGAHRCGNHGGSGGGGGGGSGGGSGGSGSSGSSSGGGGSGSSSGGGSGSSGSSSGGSGSSGSSSGSAGSGSGGSSGSGGTSAANGSGGGGSGSGSRSGLFAVDDDGSSFWNKFGFAALFLIPALIASFLIAMMLRPMGGKDGSNHRLAGVLERRMQRFNRNVALRKPNDVEVELPSNSPYQQTAKDGTVNV